MLSSSARRAILGPGNACSFSRIKILKQYYTVLHELYPLHYNTTGTKKVKGFRDNNACRQQHTHSSAAKILSFSHGTLSFPRPFATKGSMEKPQNEDSKDVAKEDPFDAPTYDIPQKPVTFAEGASYSVLILAGLGVAIAAGYAVFKELVFEPKEYKVFNKSLKRIQDDSQVRVRIGSPITGYGQESRNRAARQRIANKIFTDEDGVEHIQVGFYIRGPHGAGKVSAEMFKDKEDKEWKYTYLIVQITQPYPSQLILESYIPSAAPTAP